MPAPSVRTAAVAAVAATIRGVFIGSGQPRPGLWATRGRVAWAIRGGGSPDRPPAGTYSDCGNAKNPDGSYVFFTFVSRAAAAP